MVQYSVLISYKQISIIKMVMVMQLNYPKIIKLNRIIKKTKEKGVFEMRTE
jgi:hypothetical protein